MKRNRALYQIKVTLRDIHPPIWRRIQVWEDTTLAQLHAVLQVTMGWQDCHLHQFVIGSGTYSIPDPDEGFNQREVIDEKRTRLAKVVKTVGARFEYSYDFGDDWHHDLLVEALLLPSSATFYPRCLAGERNAPPEDVGGAGGYEHYLEAIGNPTQEEHSDMLQWSGPFNPEAFALAAVNQQLQANFASARKTIVAPVVSKRSNKAKATAKPALPA